MYFVVKGEMRMLRRSMAGVEMVLQTSRGGFLAEASIDQKIYHCDALAIADCRLLAFPRTAFIQALSDETFRQIWLSHLARELRCTRAQVERLGLKTAVERILHFIEAEGLDGTIVLTRSKKDWAGELGLTHEALYRALSKLERQGQIAVDGATLRILSRRSIACIK